MKNELIAERFEIDKAMSVKIIVLWVVTPCGLYFYREDVGIKFLRNVRTYLPHYIVLDYRTL